MKNLRLVLTFAPVRVLSPAAVSGCGVVLVVGDNTNNGKGQPGRIMVS